MNEWENEPKEDSFLHAGFQCEITRGPLGAWCGYVAVPAGHPLHGKDYHEHIPVLSAVHEVAMNGEIGKRGIVSVFCAKQDVASMDICFDVHGSVTFCGPRKSKDDPLWWIGFDCSHSGDFIPGSRMNDGVYRDIEYVRAETKSLAEQIAKVNRE